MSPAVPGAEDRREINRWLANLYLTEVDAEPEGEAACTAVQSVLESLRAC